MFPTPAVLGKEICVRAHASVVQKSARVRVLDPEGRHAYVGEPGHAAWLLRMGYGIGLGTKRRIRCIRLTVPLALLAGAEVVGRATLASDLNVRFTECEKYAGRPVFKHKDYLRKDWNREACLATVRSVGGTGRQK